MITDYFSEVQSRPYFELKEVVIFFQYDKKFKIENAIEVQVYGNSKFSERYLFLIFEKGIKVHEFLVNQHHTLNRKDQKVLNRREIEEAVETLQNLAKDGFYNVPKITWWLLHYKELYTYAYEHRHDGSCIKDMGCSCSWDNPESKFSDLYPALQEIVELHQYEKYFKEEMATLENVRHDHPALMQWLKKNEKLGAEEFILFWIEWYEEEKEAIIPFILNWKDLEIKFKAAEWQHTIRFLKVFNEIYWTSNACP